MAEGLSLIEALVLGVVQGLTEWLPVSSSGHLVLTQEFLGLEATVFFDLVLHVGTLAVVLVFYRSSVAAILASLPSLPSAWREHGPREALWHHPERRLALLVVLGSVPTAIIGFTFEDTFVAWFSSLLVVGIALVATGTWLALSRLAPHAPSPGQLTLVAALLVGTAQGLAIIPGVSRSGATIVAALLLGVERELAVRYSFLLSVPAIAGATLFQADATNLDAALSAWPVYLAGLLAALVVGYAALWLLVQLVKRRAFHHFSWYCWGLGGAVLAYVLL